MMESSEYYFDGQRDNEKVLFVWRRNPWTEARMGIIIVVISWLVAGIVLGSGTGPVSSVAIGVWLLLVPTIAWYEWFIWWNDIYILTNLRLIDIDQKNVFHRVVAEVPLENIQDVIFETKGLFSTVLNYGDVNVQTASGLTVISISGITDPMAIQQAILRQVSARVHVVYGGDEEEEETPSEKGSQIKINRN